MLSRKGNLWHFGYGKVCGRLSQRLSEQKGQQKFSQMDMDESDHPIRLLVDGTLRPEKKLIR